MSTAEIKVRFAPSPTGSLHIGGVRTALFNYLYARNQGGRFFLRIEDTDRERSKREFEDEITESLRWLGLEWDEPLSRQSERFDVYRQKAEELFKKDLAYEELKDGKRALRLKVPQDQDSIVFHDLVHGKISFQKEEVGDLVIIKSDGTPTYNFACVIDDADLGITHIIRGDDHISNTPKQLVIYDVLGITPPKFAHIPLIVGADRAPLSKRHGAVALKAYKKEGFLAEGLVNYLALLGWGPGTNQEFFSKEELIKKFSVKRVNKTSSTFDNEKLRWLDGQHIKALDDESYCKRATEYLKAEKLVPDSIDAGQLKRILMLLKERIKTFKDVAQLGSYLLSSTFTFREESVKKYLTGADTKKNLGALADSLEKVANLNAPADFETIARNCAGELGVKAAELIHPARVALTGTHVSPGLFDIMALLGKDEVVRRLRRI